MRKARSPRRTTSDARSSEPSRALQNTQPSVGCEPRIQGIRHGAQSRFNARGEPSRGGPQGEASRVDQLAQPLADLEERYAFLGNVDGASGLGIPTFTRIPMADA